MQRDSDAGPTESQSRTPDWKLWLTSPRHLAATVAGVVAGGFLLGYLVAALAVFPSQGVGSDLQTVPDLAGLSVEEARTALQRRGLGYEQVASLNHPQAPLGTVVAQDPLPGQRLASGSAVGVTLSMGAKVLPVPDVVGLDHEQASVALRGAGFEIDSRRVDAEEVVGQVVSTDPLPGTPVRLPGRVTLIVSAGPPAVAIPDLVTRASSEAQKTLERLGLQLGSVSRDSTSLAAPGTVIGQSPTAGTVVRRGTRVSVTVAIVPPPVARDSIEEVPDPEPDTMASRKTTTGREIR